MTTLSPFTPIGSKSKWEMAYEVLSVKSPGETATYDEIAAALEGEHTRAQIQSIVHQAAPRLLESQKKALEAVRNVGYRVVLSNEHVRLAGKQQGRASKALSRGTKQVLHVDFNDLSETEKAIVQATGQALAAQADFMRRLDIRQRRTDKALAGVVGEVAQVKAEHSEAFQALQERIARLEGTPSS